MHGLLRDMIASASPIVQVQVAAPEVHVAIPPPAPIAVTVEGARRGPAAAEVELLRTELARGFEYLYQVGVADVEPLRDARGRVVGARRVAPERLRPAVEASEKQEKKAAPSEIRALRAEIANGFERIARAFLAPVGKPEYDARGNVIRVVRIIE